MKKFLYIIIIISTTICAQEKTPIIAPLNPEFIRYINELKEGKEIQIRMPSPFHPDFNALIAEQQTKDRSLPSSYDMRTAGPGGTSLLTPVKNQLSCGACWAFATMGAVESNWKKMGLGDHNLSENNLKNCHGFEMLPCQFGYHYFSSAYFARIGGPISEDDDHYSPTNGSCTTGLTPQAFLTEAIYFPSDANTIKQAILDYGGIYTTFNANNTKYYNSQDYTYCNPAGKNTTHAVAIVGWDDNKVVTGGYESPPSSNGAFIIRDSYGSSKENGYFYIGYKDNLITDFCACWPVREDYINNSAVYSYSKLGSYNSTGYNDQIGYGLVKFNISQNQQINKIGTFINASLAEFDFEIYDDFNVASGTLSNLIAGVYDQTQPFPGYYFVDLPVPVHVTTDNDIYIKVRYYTTGYNYPIPIENYIQNYADPVIDSNVCWISGTGTDGDWFLIGNSTQNYKWDLCIYAYAEPLTVWNGSNSTAWNYVSNWSNGIPDSATNVLITSTSYKPILNTNTQCNSISIGSGDTLTINSNKTLYINGDFFNSGILVNNGTITVDSTATVGYFGSTAQTIDSNLSIINNLLIKNSANVTLSKNITVKSALTLQDGSICLSGNSISYGSEGCLIYKGVSQQTTSNSEFPSTNGPKILKIDNPNGVILHANRTIDSTLILKNGQLDNSAYTLNIANNQSIIRYNGSIASAPGFVTCVNVEYAGDTAITTGNEIPAGTSVLNNLILNNKDTVTLNQSCTINGDFFLKIGQFNNSGNTLTLANGVEIIRYMGSLSSAPTFGSGINMTYIGSVGVNTAYEMPLSTTVLNNLTIDNPGDVTLSNNLTVNGTLTLTAGEFNNSGNTLTIANGQTILLNADFLNGYYGNEGKLTAAPSFGSNVNIDYRGQMPVTTGYELPDSSTNILNNLSINTYLGVTLNKHLKVKGSVIISGYLDCKDKIIDGIGTFNINARSSLGVGDADGIDFTNGNIIIAGNKTFHNDVNYFYNGSVPQVIGPDINDTLYNLTISNTHSQGVTLMNKDIIVNRTLTIQPNSKFTISNGKNITIW